MSSKKRKDPRFPAWHMRNKVDESPEPKKEPAVKKS